MLETLRNLIAFVLVLGGLIFFHELGHFIVSIKLGVKIKEFGIGFPPRLLILGKWNKTIFTLNAIPLGGFVRPAGEDDPAVKDGLAAARPMHRLAILAAGSVTNLLLGILVLTFGFTSGWPDRVSIVEVASESPAASIGLQTGDIILSANDQDVHLPAELAAVTYDNLGQPILLEIDRQGKIMEMTVIPRRSWPENQGPIGVSLSWQIIDYPIHKAAARAVQEAALQIKEIVQLPVQLITSQIQPSEVRLISPIGLKAINDHAVDAAVELGELFPILQLLAFVSLALAVTNLMPLPALDGGRILFVLVEIIRGRRISPEKEGLVHFMGMTMLLGLMAVLVVQDLIDPILIPK